MTRASSLGPTSAAPLALTRARRAPKLLDSVVETDEGLMERYLEGDQEGAQP